MDIFNILSLLCGVSLFLYGMSLMGDGLKKVAGSKLEIILYKLSGTPLKGVLLGTGVTAVIQSSSATSVMVVGFVNSGMMKLKQATSIILGAILGTSITGWIICLSDIGGSEAGWLRLFSTATITSVVAIIGILFRMVSKSKVKKDVGTILMGFAVLMLGMSSMSGAVAPLKEMPEFINFMTAFSNPILGILAGMVITSVLQSASAAVGILQALAVTGAIDFSVALPLIMGIAIGAAVPVLISAFGADTDGKRTALIYLIIDTLGVIICGGIFYIVNAFVRFDFMNTVMTTVSISAVNTFFRLATVIVLFPLIGFMTKLVKKLVKPKKGSAVADTSDIEKLEERFLTHPALAIEQSKEAISSMAYKAAENINRAFTLIHEYSDTEYNAIQEIEAAVDKYEDKLGSYLVRITRRELNPEQGRSVSKFLHTISDFERISDHAANLSEVAVEIKDKKVEFSPEATHEMSVIETAVSEIVGLATKAFIDNDLSLAKRVEPLEERIDELCDEVKLRHIHRIQKGECTLMYGFVFNDLLTNFERVADHCSNIAVAMIEIDLADSFDTHEYLAEVKSKRDEEFESCYKEYASKFDI